MNSKCKKCKHYANTNEKMKPSHTKVIVGDYCLKFKWNLARVKTWVQQQSEQKGVTLPHMSKLPGDCYERK